MEVCAIDAEAREQRDEGLGLHDPVVSGQRKEGDLLPNVLNGSVIPLIGIVHLFLDPRILARAAALFDLHFPWHCVRWLWFEEVIVRHHCEGRGLLRQGWGHRLDGTLNS